MPVQFFQGFSYPELAYMGICLRQGITLAQLSALLDIVEKNLGKEYTAPLRATVRNFADK